MREQMTECKAARLCLVAVGDSDLLSQSDGSGEEREAGTFDPGNIDLFRTCFQNKRSRTAQCVAVQVPERGGGEDFELSAEINCFDFRIKGKFVFFRFEFACGGDSRVCFRRLMERCMQPDFVSSRNDCVADCDPFKCLVREKAVGTVGNRNPVDADVVTLRMFQKKCQRLSERIGGAGCELKYQNGIGVAFQFQEGILNGEDIFAIGNSSAVDLVPAEIQRQQVFRTCPIRNSGWNARIRSG